MLVLRKPGATRPQGRTTQAANARFAVRGPERPQQTQLRSQKGQPPKLPRGTAAKARARLARTHAKVQQRKHECIIAEVLAEIKRKRAGPEHAREEPVGKRRKLPHGLASQGSKTLASQGTKTCQYICPHCKATVESTIANGQVDDRAVCGSQFYVSDGKVQAKKQHEYECPHCGGLVASNVTTGQINHRTVCGNRFDVSDGKVKEKQKHEYTCPHCGGLVASNVTTGQIDHRTVCGNQFNVSDGKVKEKQKHEYTCPHCGGLVASNVTTGQILAVV